VTFNASSTLNTGLGTLTVDGDGGTIDLAGSTLTSTNAGEAITFQDATTVILGNVNATAGTFVVGIGQDVTGTVTQAPGTDLDVGTLTASTNNSINLPSATNTVGALATLVSGGPITVFDLAGGVHYR
jgi:hypothetical protein